MFLGFRISEVLALAIGHVLHHGQIRSHVALPPRFLKGKRGNTRSVPIGPELHRALDRYLAQRAREKPLTPTEPLFRSRFHAADGGPDHVADYLNFSSYQAGHTPSDFSVESAL